MNSTLRKILLSFAIATPLLVGCDRQTTSDELSMQTSAIAPVAEPTPAQWQRIASLRIVFGHQSVGNNILAGIQSLASAQNIPLVITESREPLTTPGIQHFHVGRNEDPDGKLIDFGTVINKEGVPDPDVALLKFCFIDFSQRTDSIQLAQHYIATLDELARTHPHTIFIPMTSPLTVVESGPRAWLKQILGREPGDYASNAQRYIFNQTLRAHYRNTQQLFDIAALESEHGRIGAKYQGAHIEALDPQISDDGGHLNLAGQRLLGGALIAHIATVSKP